jgi:hypothetical protein
MKAVKIGLAAIVVLAIAFFVIRSLLTIGSEGSISLPRNQFTERIEKEIDVISKFSDNKFCKEAYENVMYLIDDYYKPLPPKYPYGRFGNTQSENNQWKENLTKNLYSVYAGKFISQAFYVFRGSEWSIDDLRFIRSEYQILRKSNLLEKGSPVDKKFIEIQTILSKYDEIAGFISACNGFSYSSSSLSDRFPLSDVQGKISRAATYRNNQMENAYVNNCRRLRDGLKEIPVALFRAHTRYLANKISQWSDLYSNYNSQSDYANNLYKPLKSEIDAMDNETYNVANFDSEYQRLSTRWSADNTKAYTYSYPSKH